MSSRTTFVLCDLLCLRAIAVQGMRVHSGSRHALPERTSPKSWLPDTFPEYEHLVCTAKSTRHEQRLEGQTFLDLVDNGRAFVNRFRGCKSEQEIRLIQERERVQSGLFSRRASPGEIAMGGELLFPRMCQPQRLAGGRILNGRRVSGKRRERAAGVGG